ncbi:hypothetical protein COTS27_00316 [Spirochaetota bacterium]|nr:hypothetical protein COTS27_00316 [Spirochaetota bacterium]
MKLSLRARKTIHALPIEALLPQWGELSGHETSSILGDEADFNEYKPYALGDEVRRIDWKVYMRRKRYFIKRYASERARSTLVIIDASASMKEAFTTPSYHSSYSAAPLTKPNHKAPLLTKLTAPQYATDRSKKYRQDTIDRGALGVLGYLFYYLYLKQEPYGVSLLRNNSVDFYKIRNGSSQLKRMEQMLKTLTAAGTNFYIKELIESLNQTQEVKNIIFFSDFQLEPHSLIPFIKTISRRHLSLTCIAYFNPKLLDIRFLSGLRWLKDRETGTSAILNHRDMRAYRKFIINHYEAIERFLIARGAAYHQLDFKDKDALTNFIDLFKR